MEQERDAYTHDEAHSYQAGELALACSAAPEHAGLFIGGNIEGLEGDFIGFEDGFQAGGGGDDVRGTGCERGVEVKGWVGVVGLWS